MEMLDQMSSIVNISKKKKDKRIKELEKEIATLTLEKTSIELELRTVRVEAESGVIKLQAEKEKLETKYKAAKQETHRVLQFTKQALATCKEERNELIQAIEDEKERFREHLMICNQRKIAPVGDDSSENGDIDDESISTGNNVNDNLNELSFSFPNMDMNAITSQQALIDAVEKTKKQMREHWKLIRDQWQVQQKLDMDRMKEQYVQQQKEVIKNERQQRDEMLTALQVSHENEIGDVQLHMDAAHNAELAKCNETLKEHQNMIEELNDTIETLSITLVEEQESKKTLCEHSKLRPIQILTQKNSLRTQRDAFKRIRLHWELAKKQKRALGRLLYRKSTRQMYPAFQSWKNYLVMEHVSSYREEAIKQVAFVVGAERLKWVLIRLRMGRLQTAFRRWNVNCVESAIHDRFSEELGSCYNEKTELEEEVGLLYSQLADAKAESWKLKRKMLKSFVIPKPQLNDGNTSQDNFYVKGKTSRDNDMNDEIDDDDDVSSAYSWDEDRERMKTIEAAIGDPNTPSLDSFMANNLQVAPLSSPSNHNNNKSKKQQSFTFPDKGNNNNNNNLGTSNLQKELPIVDNENIENNIINKTSDEDKPIETAADKSNLDHSNMKVEVITNNNMNFEQMSTPILSPASTVMASDLLDNGNTNNNDHQQQKQQQQQQQLEINKENSDVNGIIDHKTNNSILGDNKKKDENTMGLQHHDSFAENERLSFQLAYGIPLPPPPPPEIDDQVSKTDSSAVPPLLPTQDNILQSNSIVSNNSNNHTIKGTKSTVDDDYEIQKKPSFGRNDEDSVSTVVSTTGSAAVASIRRRNSRNNSHKSSNNNSSNTIPSSSTHISDNIISSSNNNSNNNSYKDFDSNGSKSNLSEHNFEAKMSELTMGSLGSETSVGRRDRTREGSSSTQSQSRSRRSLLPLIPPSKTSSSNPSTSTSIREESVDYDYEPFTSKAERERRLQERLAEFDIDFSDDGDDGKDKRANDNNNNDILLEQPDDESIISDMSDFSINDLLL
eukprot:TRINITY_DN1624_c0_g1_i1.p1 TRINITY_DN1624_c0_g1~~TRINITY_DN1624_c0_g1_i1.p1  ORF type:complete len:1010 (-),score=364.07 TRINITY_DN1624_c0_g1_i1:201-3230(-)